MKVKIIRHWGKGDKEFGEYLVEGAMGSVLVFQNGLDYRAIAHFVEKPIVECVEPVHKNVINLIRKAVEDGCGQLKFSNGGAPYYDTSKYYEIEGVWYGEE